jgi:squalene-hopene/tetraprenyl-beta-curcumene cyclase
MTMDPNIIQETLENARRALLAAARGGHWAGELSASALSTAVAAGALAMVDREQYAQPIGRALDWLAEHANADGGWGDTTDSPSNISTTTLGVAAMALARSDQPSHQAAAGGAREWIAIRAGSFNPDDLTRAILDAYGDDRTFSVPILSACALAGLLGEGDQAWRRVDPLPFELAMLPHRLLKFLRLPVVSYALPALIAIGQLRYRKLPPRCPVTRTLRRLALDKTLAVLERIQPESGGFLEAAPLTGFVAMSLAGMGLAHHPVARRAVAFVLASVRADGSWPIDTNLATWVTTLAVNALAGGKDFPRTMPEPLRQSVRAWLLAQQYRRVHPYTHADPGGWAWTDLSGGVPDADDTPGALLALRRLGPIDADAIASASAGVRWLLDIQNRDGGIPTFCRGWGKLPFDRSAADLTAHCLLAWSAWLADLPADLAGRTRLAMARALAYLETAQRPDGAWLPLWFGSQSSGSTGLQPVPPGSTGFQPVQTDPRQQENRLQTCSTKQPDSTDNPTYGTARVLMALATFADDKSAGVSGMIARGAGWLLAAQNPDGGWGGDTGAESSIEETALAVDALARLAGASEDYAPSLARGATRVQPNGDNGLHTLRGIAAGAAWLVERTQRGTHFPPAPIGLYFARLWYSEQLYPVIFTVSALERRAATAPPQRPAL